MHTMSESTSPRFLWRVIILLIVVGVLGTSAVPIRDSGLTVGSTEWVVKKILGPYPPWSLVDAIANLTLQILILLALLWLVLPRYRGWLIIRDQHRRSAVTSASTTDADCALVPDAPLSDPAQDELERF